MPIAVTDQPQGPIPVTDTFAGDAEYQNANAARPSTCPRGRQLTVTPAPGTYNASDTVSGTLVNTYTTSPCRTSR